MAEIPNLECLTELGEVLGQLIAFELQVGAGLPHLDEPLLLRADEIVESGGDGIASGLCLS